MVVFSFINMKGGVAKTTLAINVADCLARRHDQRILLIDVDPQFNATQCLMAPDAYVEHLKKKKDTVLNIFDRAPRITASAVKGTGSSSAKSLSSIKPVAIKRNLSLIPGNLDLYRLEMAPGEGRENRLSRFITALSEADDYDYVIIDTPPTPSVWMTSALIASNYYIIPVKPDPISFTGIDLLRSVIEDKTENFDLKLRCAGLVLTIVEETTLVYRQAIQQISKDQRWKAHKYAAFLPKRTEVARMQRDQQLILDSDDSTLLLALTSITQEIMDRIGQDDQQEE